MGFIFCVKEGSFVSVTIDTPDDTYFGPVNQLVKLKRCHAGGTLFIKVVWVLDFEKFLALLIRIVLDKFHLIRVTAFLTVI